MALAREDYVIAVPPEEALARLREATPRLRWKMDEEAGLTLFFLRRGVRGAWISGSGSRLAVSLQTEGERTLARLTAWGSAESDPHASIWCVLANAGFEPSLAESMTRPVARSRPGTTPWWAKLSNVMRYGVVPVFAFDGMMAIRLGWHWAGAGTLLLWLLLVTLPVATEDALARRMMGVRSRRGMLQEAGLLTAWGAALGLLLAAIASALT
jgi:hypothetical protein